MMMVVAVVQQRLVRGVQGRGDLFVRQKGKGGRENRLQELGAHARVQCGRAVGPVELREAIPRAAVIVLAAIVIFVVVVVLLHAQDGLCQLQRIRHHGSNGLGERSRQEGLER